MLVYLLLDMIFSSKLTVFFHTFQKLHFSSRRFRFSEQLILADKYPRIFSYEMEAIVYLFHEPAYSFVFLPTRATLSVYAS